MTDRDPDLVEAQGTGAELFDAPTSFYLTHRRSIEAWHSLRRAADQTVHEFLRSMVDPIAELAQEHGWDPRFLDFGGRYFAQAALAVGPDGPNGPALCVGLGWQRREVRPDDPENAPYVGIRTSRDATDLRAWLMEFGRPSVRDLREANGYRGDRRWPVFRYVPATSGWWADLDGYRDECTAQLRTLINDFRPAIDAAQARQTM
jgi:hypothetical protein